MLEVHAILHRQRCYENMTEKTGTLSDAYKNPNMSEYLQLYWNYIEGEWKYDTEVEILLRDNPSPFRSVIQKRSTVDTNNCNLNYL